MDELRAFSPLADDDQQRVAAQANLERFLEDQTETIEFTTTSRHRRFDTPPRISSAELLARTTPTAATSEQQFDPYQQHSIPKHNQQQQKKNVTPNRSLLDVEEAKEEEEELRESELVTLSTERNNTQQQQHAFLELEPPPETTNSAQLFLTHRKPPNLDKNNDNNNSGSHSKTNNKYRPNHAAPRYSTFGQHNRLDTTNPFAPRSWQQQQQKSFKNPLDSWLKYTRWSVMALATVLVLGTVLVVHHSFWRSSAATTTSAAVATVETTTTTNKVFVSSETVVLRPLPEHRRRQLLRETTPETTALFHNNNHNITHPNQSHHHAPLILPLAPLDDLKSRFEEWVATHNKQYIHAAEKERRYTIWRDNFERTRQKNALHGPCPHTGKTVFGSNHLQDLTSEEFQDQFLNAPPRSHTTTTTLTQNNNNVLHPDTVPPPPRSLLQQQSNRRLSLFGNCKWYDVSCCLRYIFSHYLYGLGGTMEPAYDAESYPDSVDWRNEGAVTDVHSQGNCGACWAITAVETIESAYFIGTGVLYDLAETEVIVCESECEMCSGGWPQNAFEYAMKHGGLPLESELSYDGDYLLSLTEAVNGESDAMDADSVSSYQAQTCPGDQGSGDSKDNNNGGGGNNYARYGEISGWGFSTEKCVCYTDGSGCDCEDQNESYAVRNLATYGPAVVCLDASTWQDYTDGIITADSGCSQGFMDVNHCVQAVGYAFTSDGDEQENGQQNSGSGSGSNSNSGSKDDSKRKGYWIIRNQWSEYWGLNGYAWVAMGDNTCGILNDMMQAYM